MESISKIQLRLYAAKRKNGKWQLEMSRMPKRISVIGRTPIVDEHYMPSDLEVVSMSKLHKYVGSYYGKIVKTLKEEGIITKEYEAGEIRFIHNLISPNFLMLLRAAFFSASCLEVPLPLAIFLLLIIASTTKCLA